MDEVLLLQIDKEPIFKPREYSAKKGGKRKTRVKKSKSKSKLNPNPNPNPADIKNKTH